MSWIRRRSNVLAATAGLRCRRVTTSERTGRLGAGFGTSAGFTGFAGFAGFAAFAGFAGFAGLTALAGAFAAALAGAFFAGAFALLAFAADALVGALAGFFAGTALPALAGARPFTALAAAPCALAGVFAADLAGFVVLLVLLSDFAAALPGLAVFVALATRAAPVGRVAFGHSRSIPSHRRPRHRRVPPGRAPDCSGGPVRARCPVRSRLRGGGQPRRSTGRSRGTA